MNDDPQFNGAISFLVSEDGATIEIRDNVSNQAFVEVTLTAKQLCQALSRLMHTPCKIETHCLERIGTKMLMDKLEFEMPKHDYKNRKEVAEKEGARLCPEGWTPDLYFGSQHSFWSRDGKEYAVTTIRKWE